VKYTQFIENYKENYKKYNGWLKKYTDHYIFYYFNDYFIKKEINKIIKIQERSYKKILEFLNTKTSKKIKYYIYPNQETKAKFMGNFVYAQSVYKDYSVHIVYNKKIKPLGPHEDTHLLSLKIGLATSFFAEGLAECISNKRVFNGKKRIVYINNWLKKYKKIDISKYFTQKGWIDSPDNESSEFYTIAMSFTKYLIKKFGKNIFLKFYKKINRGMNEKQIINTMGTVFKSDYIQIISDWKLK